MAVFDRVGDGFAGRDEHVLNLTGLNPRLGQPAAQGGTARGELVGVGGEVQRQWSWLPVQQHGHVVRIAARGLEPRHQVVGHLIE